MELHIKQTIWTAVLFPCQQGGIIWLSCLLMLLLPSRFRHVWLCATPWTAAYQASPSMAFSRQEHWSGLPFPSPMHESGKWKWSRSVMSDSLRPHGLQHTRPLCPSPSPGVCPSSCPLHWWCHPAISSSDTLFSFCPQSFPASGTFPVSQLLASGGQNTNRKILHNEYRIRFLLHKYKM